MALPIDSSNYREKVSELLRKLRAVAIALVVTVVLAGGAMFGYQHFIAGSAEKDTREAEETAQNFADALATAFERERAALDQLYDEVELARLLAGGDLEAVSAKEIEIAGLSDRVLKVWLLSPGLNSVNYSTKPPLGYAALDILRQSEATGEVSPPVVLLGGDDQHVAVHEIIRSESGDLVGHLLFALDAGVLQGALDSVLVEEVYGELRQTVPVGEPLLLGSGGRRVFRQGTPVFVVDVSGTPWTLSVWDESRAVTAPEAGMTVPVRPAAAAVLVLLLAAVYLAMKRRRAAVKAPHTAATAKVKKAALAAKLEALQESPQGTPEEAASLAEAPVSELPSADAIVVVEDAELEPQTAPLEVPASVFRAYDVRGVVGKTLTSEMVHDIGRAIGSEAKERGQQTVVVGADGRHSSPELRDALIAGLRATGRDVIDVGRVPTPVLYFATHYLNTGSGVMVTGSHNPHEYNGLKIMLGKETLFGDAITGLRERIQTGNLETGEGGLQTMEVVDEYIRRVTEDIPVALGTAFKLVVDCGNGIAGDVAPKLFRALGHDVVELYCEVDGSFPNHPPDTSEPKNLADLITAVKDHEADLGFAFDGDGDRLGLVDGRGNIVWADRQMMLFARDVLSRNEGAQIVYDIKCSSRLGKVIKKLGGKPLMWKTGHSFIKNKMKETGALLAGEMSGHIFFKDRWYGFDDALYAGARMLEILLEFKQPPSAVLAKLPGGISTPELRVDLQEGEQLAFMERLQQSEPFSNAKLTDIDGLRADFPDGWGLIRASNTTPSLVMRFEADTQEALTRIKEEFRSVLLGVDSKLKLPF